MYKPLKRRRRLCNKKKFRKINLRDDYTPIPDVLLFDPKIPKTVIAVYAFMLKYQTKGYTIPFQKFIAQQIGYCHYAVCYAVKTLKKMGIIKTNLRKNFYDDFTKPIEIN